MKSAGNAASKSRARSPIPQQSARKDGTFDSQSGAAAFAFGIFRRSAKTLGFVFFTSRQEMEKVTVGLGAKSFCAVAIFMQKDGCEGAGCVQPVFGFKPIKRGQGNAVSAIEMAKRVKELSFQLMVRATLIQLRRSETA
jgi:hypothetical protein